MSQKHTVPILRALLLCLTVTHVCSSVAASLTMEALYRYIQQGNLRQLASYLQNSPSLEIRNNEGNTALCQAILNQDQMMVKKLVYLGANRNASCMYNIPAEKFREMGLTPRPVKVSGTYVQAARKTASTLPPLLQSSSFWLFALLGGVVAAAAIAGGGGGGGGGS